MKNFHPEIRYYMFQLPLAGDKIFSDINILKNWKPKDPGEVELWIKMGIGQKGKKNETEFTAHIVTGNLVSKLADKSKLIIIPYYDTWNSVQRKIDELIFNHHDENYTMFCERVSKHLKWEYDYSKNKTK